jgi:multiple sugar transport system substrate-binding protein
MKRILLLTTIVCILLIFTGIVLAAEEITFIAGAWMDTNAEDFKKINGYDYTERFEEETGIKVNVVTYPMYQMWQVIEVGMNAKSSEYDVLEVDGTQTASYAAKGYLEPSEDLFPPEEQKRFFPATVELAKWKGKVYNRPFENSTQFMYYNEDLFKKAGIPFPLMDVNQRWTWEKVVETAQKIQETLDKEGEPKIWGLLFDQINRPYQMVALPQSLGTGIGVTPDGIRVNGFPDDEGWIEAMTWWYNVNNIWKIHPKGVGAPESPPLFAAGNVAMYIGGSWNIAFFDKTREEGRLNYGIAPHPYFKDGKPVTPTTSWHLGINPYSKNKEAARKFIEYLTSDEIMADWFKGVKQLTANTVMNEVIATSPEYENFPLNAFKEITAYELANTATPRPCTTPLWMEWEEIMGKAFADVQNGEDPQTVLNTYSSILERMAKKYE